MIKTLFYISIASVLLTTSCKKKDEVGQQVSYTGSQQVNFNNYMDDNGNFGYHSVDLALIDSFVNVNVEVKLSNSISGATNDISIYFTKVDALVSDYNTENGTTLEPVSSASPAIDFDFSKPLILKKGTRLATATMRVNAAKFDLNKLNALGLAISKVIGAELNSGLESKLVLLFNTQGVFACGSGFALVTSGANSVDLTPGQPLINGGVLTYFSAVLPRFTVNSTTNKVTITSTNTTVFVQFPTYDSKYNPTTKSFYVKYGWSGDRVATDTFTYCGPR